MSEKLNLARLKKFGQTFEISVDSELALKYKRGQINDIRDVLQVEHIFSDAKKGLNVSPETLQKIFQTIDPLKVAEIIVKEGEIQLTAEYRTQEREQKLNRLVELIHRQAVDPQTGFPHPPDRIKAALEQGKIHLDERKTVEEQFEEVVAKLRVIIPLKIEQKRLIITIPAQYAGKSYQTVKNNSKIISEAWNPPGSWTVLVEIPPGLKLDFIDKLNALTHGQVVVEEKK